MSDAAPLPSAEAEAAYDLSAHDSHVRGANGASPAPASDTDDEGDALEAGRPMLDKRSPAPALVPMPWGRLCAIGVVTLGEGFTGSVLLPFVAFMVIDFGSSKDSVGYSAGFVTAAFFGGQFVGTAFVGTLSDRVGRRPMLLFGLAANAVCSALFGVAPALWAAVSVRFVNGLLNGSIGLVKSYVREVTSPADEAMGFGIRSAGYGLGFVLGPLCGGLLAHPTFFTLGGVFVVYPYLLPCLVAVAVNAVAFVVTLLLLRESLPMTVPLRVALRAMAPRRPPCCSRHTRRLDGDDDDDDDDNDDGHDDDMVPMHGSSGSDVAVAAPDSITAPQRGLFVRLLCVPDIALVTAIYSVIGLVDLIFSECFNFWAIRSDTLSFGEAQLGLCQGVTGVVLTVAQTLLYPPLNRRAGSLWTLRACAVLAAPLLLAFPYVRLLRDTPWALWTALMVALFFLRAAIAFSYTCVNLMLSNLAPSDAIGALNGLSATFAAASRLVAPIAGGSVFALSAAVARFPFDASFVFALCAALLGLCCAASLRATPAVNVRRLTALAQHQPQQQPQ